MCPCGSCRVSACWHISLLNASERAPLLTETTHYTQITAVCVSVCNCAFHTASKWMKGMHMVLGRTIYGFIWVLHDSNLMSWVKKTWVIVDYSASIYFSLQLSQNCCHWMWLKESSIFKIEWYTSTTVIWKHSFNNGQSLQLFSFTLQSSIS